MEKRCPEKGEIFIISVLVHNRSGPNVINDKVQFGKPNVLTFDWYKKNCPFRSSFLMQNKSNHMSHKFVSVFLQRTKGSSALFQLKTPNRSSRNDYFLDTNRLIKHSLERASTPGQSAVSMISGLGWCCCYL